MIFASIVRLLCLSLFCTPFTLLQAVRIADDPYEVCASSNDGEFLTTFLGAIREKNYVQIKEILKNSSIQKLINAIAVQFIPLGKVVSTLPLLQAISVGDPEIVQMLLAAGANPLCKAPNYYMTPFHLAASYHTEHQKFVHQCFSYSQNLISLENAEKIFELLIGHIHKNSIDCFCVIGQEPMTALSCAATFGNNYMITQQLVRAGAKVHRRDLLNLTLPHRAVAQGNFLCFHALHDTFIELNPNDHAHNNEWNELLARVNSSQDN